MADLPVLVANDEGEAPKRNNIFQGAPRVTASVSPEYQKACLNKLRARFGALLECSQRITDMRDD